MRHVFSIQNLTRLVTSFLWFQNSIDIFHRISVNYTSPTGKGFSGCTLNMQTFLIFFVTILKQSQFAIVKI